MRIKIIFRQEKVIIRKHYVAIRIELILRVCFKNSEGNKDSRPKIRLCDSE